MYCTRCQHLLPAVATTWLFKKEPDLPDSWGTSEFIQFNVPLDIYRSFRGQDCHQLPTGTTTWVRTDSLERVVLLHTGKVQREFFFIWVIINCKSLLGAGTPGGCTDKGRSGLQNSQGNCEDCHWNLYIFQQYIIGIRESKVSGTCLHGGCVCRYQQLAIFQVHFKVLPG